MNISLTTGLWRHQKRRRNLSSTDSHELTCAVCGEKACGYNFDVLSCASCKVFFRRNAFQRSLRCQRGIGDCNVFGANNRKTCKFCRLQRCLEVGMKLELITPQEKLVRRSNYAGRHEKAVKTESKDPPSSTAASVKTEDGIRLESFEMSSTNSSHRVIRGTHVPSSFQSTIVSPAPCDPQQVNSQFDKLPSIFSIDVRDLETLFNQEYPRETSDPVTFTFSHSTPPTIFENIHNVDSRDEWKPLLYQPLLQSDEMFLDATFQDYSRIIQDVAMCLRCPYTESEVTQYRQIPKSLESSYNNHEIILRRIIIGLKKVPQFMCLSRQAQIHLLKRSINGILVIFVSLVYDSQTRTFNIPYQNNEFIDIYKFDFEARIRKVLENLQPCGENVNYSVSPVVDFHCSIPLCCLYHSASSFMTQLRFKFGLCRFPDHTMRNSSFFSSSLSYQTTQSLLEDPEKDYAIKFFSVFQYVITRIQAYTELDQTLVIALCLMRLFQHKSTELISNQQMGTYSTTDRYFIERTQNELNWYIQRYVKYQWSTKSNSSVDDSGNPRTNFGNATARTFADALLEEKLHNLLNIFEIVRPLEDFHIMQHQFLRHNLLTPLLQEIVSLPTPSTLSSTPNSGNSSH